MSTGVAWFFIGGIRIQEEMTEGGAKKKGTLLRRRMLPCNSKGPEIHSFLLLPAFLKCFKHKRKVTTQRRLPDALCLVQLQRVLYYTCSLPAFSHSLKIMPEDKSPVKLAICLIIALSDQGKSAKFLFL